MIDAVANQPFAAVLSDYDPGIADELTVEVYDPLSGLAVLAPSGVGITEPRPGTYTVARTVVAVGDFLVRWARPAATDPDDLVVAEEDLHVAAVPPALPPAGLPAWAPTVQDIANLCPAYTRGRIDDPSEAEAPAGAEQGAFDELTDPTVSQVEGFIRAAVREVAGRVGVGDDALLAHADLAHATVAWHAAASIEAEKAPEGALEIDGARGWKWASYVACLNELIAQARSGATRLV